MPARKSQKCARARRHFPAVYELAAFSVFGFCIAHGLSRSKFYDMLRKGEGIPRRTNTSDCRPVKIPEFQATSRSAAALRHRGSTGTMVAALKSVPVTAASYVLAILFVRSISSILLQSVWNGTNSSAGAPKKCRRSSGSCSRASANARSRISEMRAALSNV